jgi:hypothetical protein
LIIGARALAPIGLGCDLKSVLATCLAWERLVELRA